MIDIHSHILYGIDDGAKSLEMSLAMLKLSAEAGVTDIIATPHVNRRGAVPDWVEIVEKQVDLQEQANEAGIVIHIHAGAEVELNFNTLGFIKDGCRDYCLAGSRYLLCELTEQSEPEQIEKLLYEVMLRGLTPILAHPERYERIMTQPERVLDWMRQGTLTQCNTGSFRGAFGQKAQKQAEGLLRNHMVTFLGSDAHRIELRNTDVRPAQETIRSLEHGTADVWDECRRNAVRILQDKVLYPELPERWKREEKGFFSRIFH